MGRHVHFILVGLAFATLLSTGLVSAEPKDIESDTESDRGDESDRDFAATESDGEWYRYAKLDFMDLVSYDFYEGGSEGDSEVDSENDNENDYDEEIAGNSTTQCPCAGITPCYHHGTCERRVRNGTAGTQPHGMEQWVDEGGECEPDAPDCELVANTTEYSSDEDYFHDGQVCEYDGLPFTRDLRTFDPPLWKYSSTNSTCVPIATGSGSWQIYGFASAAECNAACHPEEEQDDRSYDPDARYYEGHYDDEDDHDYDYHIVDDEHHEHVLEHEHEHEHEH